VSLRDRTAGRAAHLQLLALVVASGLFRLALLTLPRLVRWDEPIYLWLGRSLWSGEGFTSPAGHPELHHVPLYPLLAGATYVLTGDPEVASNIWYVLFGALLPLPIYALARRREGFAGSQGGALLAAALAAFFPGLSSAVLGWGTMIEPLFVLLIATGVWLSGRASDRAAPRAGEGPLQQAADPVSALLHGATGLTFGLAYLTRPEGVVWLVSLAVWWLLVRVLREGLVGLRRLSTVVALGAAFLGFALVAVPYVGYLHHHTGRWMLTGKVSITYEIGAAVEKGDAVLYDQVTGTLDRTTGDTRWASSGQGGKGLLDRLREEPAAFVGRLGRNALHILKSSLTSPIFSVALLLPAAWAFFALPWTRKRVAEDALLAAGALPVATFLTFHVQQRFFAPAFPFLLIATATGLWALRHRLVPQSGRRRLAATLAVLVALAAYLGWAHGAVVRHGQESFELAHKAAGLWLRHHSPSEAKIMSRDLGISLYAERGYVTSPRASWPELLAYGRARGATHLVVDEAEARVLRPWLGILLDAPPPDIRLLATARDRHGRTWVFRLRPVVGKISASK
jgi:hypothetical protein